MMAPKTIQRPNPSKILQRKIDACVTGFKTFGEAITDALEQGRAEGFEDKEIGRMIRVRFLQAGLHRNTVSGYLPSTAKKKPRGSTHKSGKKGSVSTKNVQTDVTTEEEQDEELEQEYGKFENVKADPKQYLSEDLPKYPRPTLLKITQWMDQKIGRMLGEMLALENENTELKQELKKLKEKEGKAK